RAAKLFKRLVCGGRLILRGPHHAPVRRRQRDWPDCSARCPTTCGQESHLIISRHTAIHGKSRARPKPTPPCKITRSCPSAETNYTLSTKQKSLGRPRRFSDLTQDDRCAYVTSDCETLRNLRHLVSGTRI